MHRPVSTNYNENTVTDAMFMSLDLQEGGQRVTLGTTKHYGLI